MAQKDTHTHTVLDLCVLRITLLYSRCFSFGIGEGASTALINGMAKEGRGHAQFITGTERMQPKVRGRVPAPSEALCRAPCISLTVVSFFPQVMQSLRFALQPAVSDISVKWDLPEEVTATPLSPPITVIFQGQRLLAYYQLSGKVGTETLLLTARPYIYVPSVCLLPNVPSVTLMFSSDFKRRKWLCDSGVQVARSSVFGPPPV